jgi:hypothetical protein
MKYPQEEYLARHGISDVAVIHHVAHGTVFIAQDEPIRKWTVLSMKWVDNPLHPGEYHFCFFTPIHNGWKGGPLFEKLDELILQYDEYEDFIFEWASSRSKYSNTCRAIEGEWPAILSAWEMFLGMFDSWFVEQAPGSLKRLLFDSVDPDEDASQRMTSYQESLLILTEHHPHVLKRFKFEVLQHAYNYCDWLARLTNRS